MDFNSSVQTLTAPPGDELLTVQIELFDDNIFERHEIFVVLLSLSENSSQGAQVDFKRSAILLVITDNEHEGKLNFFLEYYN